MNIGLFFGTFNPVHIGHLILGEYLTENYDLDELWYVLSPQSPYKKNIKIADDRLRLHMLELALQNHSKLKATDIEFSLPKPSYTATTLKALSRKYPLHQFFLVMGADNLETLPNWFDYQDTISEYPVLAFPRPHFHPKPENLKNCEYLTHAPLLEVSSTYIRESLKIGRNVQFLLENEVYHFIEKSGLYK